MVVVTSSRLALAFAWFVAFWKKERHDFKKLLGITSRRLMASLSINTLISWQSAGCVSSALKEFTLKERRSVKIDLVYVVERFSMLRAS